MSKTQNAYGKTHNAFWIYTKRNKNNIKTAHKLHLFVYYNLKQMKIQIKTIETINENKFKILKH